MGGIINPSISIFAAIVFRASGNTVMAVVAGLTAVVVAASGLHMRYFARLLARQRQYVEALERGRFEDGSPEAKRFWDEMPIVVTIQDIQDVPNWVAAVNMTSTLVGLVLAIWGGVSWLSR